MGTLLRFDPVDPADAAIGARLKRWREARGQSVERLAEALSLSPEDERRAEAGRLHLDSLQVGAALKALRLPLWALHSDQRAG
ncbi:helix-turn-helix domain-containing protein [Brevundimonas aveniformis]|uniref:helix-turn-helix domain-containing protein n=1 Tax=Brevundimonas aveniformis TaxID=370977 RepID=UPI00040CA0C0|nr:helix-turn-helix domain-containing protein [Brevundimonas aveniformis]